MEFALTLPVLLALVGAALDYGWFFYRRTLVINVVHDSVRMGVNLRSNAIPSPSQTAYDNAINMLSSLGFRCPSPDCNVITESKNISGLPALRMVAAIQVLPLTGLVPAPTRIRIDQTMVQGP